MPLDQFRTQVLLLHSEQSTLDTLSSGFGDRYTVHCATSGSEALNTLGETPIHVIVSAQDLPGMSGAEALREAKKRSPETIGILLAGDSGGAVVGEREVFQVVRGGVNPSDLCRLIDNATILHLLGIDHERLVYKFQGRRYRLTDIHGHVVEGLLACHGPASSCPTPRSAPRDVPGDTASVPD